MLVGIILQTFYACFFPKNTVTSTSKPSGGTPTEVAKSKVSKGSTGAAPVDGSIHSELIGLVEELYMDAVHQQYHSENNIITWGRNPI